MKSAFHSKNFLNPIFWSVILAAVFFSVFASTGGAQNFPYVAEVSADKVRIRAGQNENFEELGLVGLGDKVVVVAESYGWFKIKLPVSGQGYVHASLVQELGGGEGLIKGNRVNVRARPRINTSIIGSLDRGTAVLLQERKDDWFRIQPVEGCFGWIKGSFLKFVSQDAPPPVLVTTSKSYGDISLPDEEPLKPEISATADKPETSPEPVAAQEKRDPSPVGVVPPETKAPSEIVVTAKGVLLLIPSSRQVGGLRYQLVGADGQTYILQGEDSLLSGFLEKIVEVEGKPQPDLQLPHTVLAVTKIRRGP